MDNSELIVVHFSKLLQSSSYSAIVIGTQEKRFAIYVEPQVGRDLQSYLAQHEKPRPLTHELLSGILNGFEIKILQIVIQDVQENIFFAHLFLEQKVGEERHIVEIDARPSDCISLAVMHNVPLYCRKEILDKAVAYED